MRFSDVWKYIIKLPLHFPNQIRKDYYLFQSFIINDFKIPSLGRCSKRDICPSGVATMPVLLNLMHFLIIKNFRHKNREKKMN